MKISRTRYESAKQKLKSLQASMQKYKKTIEAWENSVKTCSFKDQVMAVTLENGKVRYECESPQLVVTPEKKSA